MSNLDSNLSNLSNLIPVQPPPTSTRNLRLYLTEPPCSEPNVKKKVFYYYLV